MDKLKKYIEKRDFSKTKEPKAKPGKKTKKSMFVIQKHNLRIYFCSDVRTKAPAMKANKKKEPT